MGTTKCSGWGLLEGRLNMGNICLELVLNKVFLMFGEEGKVKLNKLDFTVQTTQQQFVFFLFNSVYSGDWSSVAALNDLILLPKLVLHEAIQALCLGGFNHGD